MPDLKLRLENARLRYQLRMQRRLVENLKAALALGLGSYLLLHEKLPEANRPQLEHFFEGFPSKARRALNRVALVDKLDWALGRVDFDRNDRE